ncbi:MAG: 23S rRNA (uracil(1939)-C(5))-methyltransferase RlmD [Lachnospiraceae bacterium]|nr:23S rRNA (uracil(1939)-C(5))-methyltransferase RlmD [Lachnospiraceae bacterium]
MDHSGCRIFPMWQPFSELQDERMSKKKEQIDLTPYENREAICPHFGKCGGCMYQKISYDRQLEMKAAYVKELLDEACSGTDFEFEGIWPSPSEEGYRNKMEFTFGDEYKDGPFSLGLHQKKSFMNIVNITDCHLIHPDMNLVRNTVRDYFQPFYERGEVSFRNAKTRQGWLRHLLLRRADATGEILVVLVTTSELTQTAPIYEAALLEGLKDLLLMLPLDGQIAGFLHILNDALSDTVQSDQTNILYGRDHIYEEILGLRFRISVFSFFQTNSKGAEVLYGKAREYASSAHGLLFDLYSGTGTITQIMAAAVDEAVGVEIVEEAVESAKENAVLNGIDNVRFVAADVLKALDDLPQPDSIILDPPREGVNPKALWKILSYGVENIVYVSCKPTSLARDIAAFRAAGYELKKACCVDMFPETEHVETIASLQRQPS